MTNSPDFTALAATPEGRAQMQQALAAASVTETQAVLDLLGTAEVKELEAKLSLYAERAGDPKLRGYAGNVAESIRVHRTAIEDLLVSAKLSAGS